MRPLQQLVKVQHGSHLYGTNSPSSDLDFKGVHLPSGRAILLGRPEDVRDYDVVAKEGTKNTADAVDYQSYSLHKFAVMLSKGDTVATEILFAPRAARLEEYPLWTAVRHYGARLLNRQAKGFVGYCQRQAAKYGLKGSRMAAVKLLVDFLEHKPPSERLSTIERELHELSAGQEHMVWEDIPSPNGETLWHIVCCDRKMPMTAHIGEAYKVYRKVWENYGERARAAMTNEGIDWKAISHAVRVARQALELLQTHTITFPRPDAAELFEIKQGLRPYRDVAPMLEALVAEVNACPSTLPEATDPALIDELVETYYLPQVTER